MEFLHIIGTERFQEVENMEKKNFILGMGMGLAVGGAAAMMMKPKKSKMKSAVGKTLKTMGDVADAISTSFGL